MANTAVNPQVIITVAVDCALVYSQSSDGMYAGKGIYMMDNQVVSGSSSEGGLELFTKIPAPMDFIGFNVFDINLGMQYAEVEIEGLEVSDGPNIFTSNGMPQPQTSSSSTSQWMGQAMQQSGNQNMTYQLKIGISYPNQPKKYYYWDPFMNLN